MAKSFTVPQVLTAIRNSGGVMSAIAHSLECDWHTADDFIDKHPTLVQAVKDEKHQITDKAKYNVVKAINDGDLQLSKWWLQVMDEEFIERNKVDVTTNGESLNVDDKRDEILRKLDSIAAAGITGKVSKKSDSE